MKIEDIEQCVNHLSILQLSNGMDGKREAEEVQGGLDVVRVL